MLTISDILDKENAVPEPPPRFPRWMRDRGVWYSPLSGEVIFDDQAPQLLASAMIAFDAAGNAVLSGGAVRMATWEEGVDGWH